MEYDDGGEWYITDCSTSEQIGDEDFIIEIVFKYTATVKKDDHAGMVYNPITGEWRWF